MSVANLIQIKEKLNLCNIWQIRHPNGRSFAIRKYHATGFFQRRLDYFLISNILPDSNAQTNKLRGKDAWGNGLWKFNNSLFTNSQFATKLKNHTVDTFLTMD